MISIIGFKAGSNLIRKKIVVYFLCFKGRLIMQVTHAGYRDPNDLKFENITILGVPNPPVSITVSSGWSLKSTTIRSNTKIQYDAEKKVNTQATWEDCSQISIFG